MSSIATQSDASVIGKFFGRKPGQTLKELSEELKALTAEDKAELRSLIEAQAE